MEKGLIYNIQRFSLYDGPGIRTVIFFKGCNLRCLWCHNPESISRKRQLMFSPHNCIGCGECFKICRKDAHCLDDRGIHRIDREQCINCFDCVDTCYAEALEIVGQEVKTEYLKNAILTDLPYYKKSNGGVTFSGGECMLQIDFLKKILAFCKEQSIHTAVDTAGNIPWDSFEKILDVADLYLYDIKAADSDVHKRLTGVGNSLILQNLKRLSNLNKRIHIRVPYIPDANDKQMEKIADIIKDLNVECAHILPYHKLGISKHKSLDSNIETKDFDTPSKEEIDSVLELFRDRKINAISNNN